MFPRFLARSLSDPGAASPKRYCRGRYSLVRRSLAFYTIRDVNLLYWNKRIATMKKGKNMERYKVILVDDEAEVIDMIEKKIHWNDLGFEVAGSATNGVKALELVEKLQPDVVLTDIKMPYMDGLELSRRLNQEYPNIYIMLCTGFDEFEYAKEAVHLEIKEYMLKPVNATELSESLTISAVQKMGSLFDGGKKRRLFSGSTSEITVQLFYFIN